MNINCLCGGNFVLKHKSAHFKTAKHKRYEESNGIVPLVKSTSILCVCGGKYSKSNRADHFRTAKHQKYEESNGIVVIESISPDSIYCFCEGSYTIENKSTHCKTARHQLRVNQYEDRITQRLEIATNLILGIDKK